eukprot:NODE_16789_length_977_cov_4.821176.p1 GENE.NODE_16789_length_977_cov_4.821176~~NODE_16789_length_977_cov_4.821176.p1  ORF type:complete len:278 (-),score=67.07 NODE_16789_length_977_cov_4.821176:144-920(-)
MSLPCKTLFFAVLARSFMVGAAATCSGDMCLDQEASRQVREDTRLLQVGQSMKQPHLLFVLVDDLGANDFLTSSDLRDAWPNMQELAHDECITIVHYYTMALCTPSRGAFISGRYPIRNGLQHSVIGNAEAFGLDLSEKTLADKVKEVGYATLGVGKWHLGMYKNASLPTRRGFDHFYGFYTGAIDYFSHTFRVDDIDFLDLHDDEETDDSQDQVYSTHIFTRKVIEGILDHADSGSGSPLFVYYAIPNPHSPGPQAW